jgi:type II secretory pathway pseudopilin PulG
MWNSTKSGLFLIEMIIAIACFSIAGAMCTNLFVRASNISEDTRRVNMALIKAQSAAECFKAADGSAGETARLLNASEDGESFSLYYDSAWQQLAGKAAAEKLAGSHMYRLDITVAEGASPRTAAIEVYSLGAAGPEDELLYRLNVKKYVQ